MGCTGYLIFSTLRIGNRHVADGMWHASFAWRIRVPEAHLESYCITHPYLLAFSVACRMFPHGWPGLSGDEGETCCNHCSSLLQRCSKTSDKGCRDNRRVAGKNTCCQCVGFLWNRIGLSPGLLYEYAGKSGG